MSSRIKTQFNRYGNQIADAEWTRVVSVLIAERIGWGARGKHQIGYRKERALKRPTNDEFIGQSQKMQNWWGFLWLSSTSFISFSARASGEIFIGWMGIEWWNAFNHFDGTHWIAQAHSRPPFIRQHSSLVKWFNSTMAVARMNCTGEGGGGNL